MLSIITSEPQPWPIISKVSHYLKLLPRQMATYNNEYSENSKSSIKDPAGSNQST